MGIVEEVVKHDGGGEWGGKEKERKGILNQVASKTGTVSGTIRSRVKKFVSKYQEEIF
jgi:hypothetical protein